MILLVLHKINIIFSKKNGHYILANSNIREIIFQTFLNKSGHFEDKWFLGSKAIHLDVLLKSFLKD